MIGSIVTFLFFAEAGLKIVAQGFVIHPLSYMRDFWNLIDFTIVIFG